ncbi:MAG TPA: hypothetical protein PLH96_00910 [Candidatus Paceibacterota bacterium]|jgi:hypothetical protein|nr:hypothetical protein [Candidatus Paceibacterota bacterium]
MENSSPNPSFSICDIRIQKRVAECFAKSFSPENSFGKTESALVPPPARILGRQNPERKTPFPFLEKIHPRQIRNARSVFSFGVAEALRGGGGTVHSFSFRSKKVRANAKITPPNKLPSKEVEPPWGAELLRSLLRNMLRNKLYVKLTSQGPP